MKYAVLRDRGNQYKVAEGEEFLVDHFDGEKFEPEILLLVDGEDVSVGTPVLSKVKANFSILKESEKGEKIRVFKYKAKSRYRKTIGSRPVHTRIKLEKIA